MAEPVIPDFGEASSCVEENRLFCTDWVRDNWGDVLQPALIQHIRKASISAGPKIPRARFGCKQRNITAPQVFNFSRDHLCQAGSIGYFFPEAVKQAVAVQGIAQHVGMKTIVQ